MKRADIERGVKGIAWPEPTDDLRTRVLRAAPIEARRVTWYDRVWFSRAWRLSAAAAIVGAIAIDSRSGTMESAPSIPDPRTFTEAQAIDDTGREFGLPMDFAGSLAQRALTAVPSGVRDQDAWLTLQAIEAEGDRR